MLANTNSAVDGRDGTGSGKAQTARACLLCVCYGFLWIFVQCVVQQIYNRSNKWSLNFELNVTYNQCVKCVGSRCGWLVICCSYKIVMGITILNIVTQLLLTMQTVQL